MLRSLTPPLRLPAAFALGLALALPAGGGIAAAAPPVTRPAEAEAAPDFAPFGINVPTPPAGMTRLADRRFAEIGHWLRLRGDEPELSLQLTLFPAENMTAAAYAKRTAEQVAKEPSARDPKATAGPATVADSDLKVGGEPTSVLTWPNGDGPAAGVGNLPVRRAFVTRVGDRVYLLLDSAAGDAGRADADAFARGIAFADPQPPSRHLDAGRHYVPLFDTPYLMFVPEPLRPVDSTLVPKATSAYYKVVDIATRRTELEVRLSEVGTQKGMTAQAFATAVGAQLTTKSAATPAVKFEAVRQGPQQSQGPAVFLSNVFALPEEKGPDGGAARRHRIVIVSPGPGRAILADWSIENPDAEAAYADAIEAAAKSVRKSDTYLDARGAARDGQGQK